MTYHFPDVASALAGDPARGEGLLSQLATVYLHLESDFASNLPALHVITVGGSETGPLRTDRVQINGYARGRDAAKALIEDARALLVPGPHETFEGLLDLVTVEVIPRPVPYPDDVISQWQVTLGIDTRAI